MTILTRKSKEKVKSKINERFIICSVILLLILTVTAANEVRDAIISGFRLSVLSVVPAIFPFLIFSDILSCESGAFSEGIFARAFERIFKINRAALGAFVCGSICGFPIGVSMASRLYTANIITKNECERIIGFSSNPSIAFVVSGVGMGMYGSITYGIILYFSLIISSVIVGLFFRCECEKTHNSSDITEQNFNIIDSIKTAGISCITISSYIVFCSAMVGLIKRFVKNDIIIIAITSLLEISNGAQALSLCGLPTMLKLSFTAFVLSFSGISVLMQARSILPAKISMIKYYKMKIVSAMLSFILTFFALSLL